MMKTRCVFRSLLSSAIRGLVSIFGGAREFEEDGAGFALNRLNGDGDENKLAPTLVIGSG